MTIKKAKEKIGATPGKLALIAVLAVVLVVVVVGQFPKKPNVAARPAETVTAAANLQKAIVDDQPLSVDDLSNSRPWPEFSLKESVVYDPFKKPDWIAVESVATTTEDESNDPEALSRLQKLGASIVVITDQGKTATIGTQQVQVGDILEGYRITDITTEGVVLKELQSR